MKQILFTIALMVSSILPTMAQNENATLQELADRMALKGLVDTFSNLADTRDVEAQVLLYISVKGGITEMSESLVVFCVIYKSITCDKFAIEM